MVVTVPPVGLDGEHRARLHRLPVEVHGAGPARRGVAADVGAGEPDDVADEVHEQRAGLDVVSLLGAVDGDRDLHPSTPCLPVRIRATVATS